MAPYYRRLDKAKAQETGSNFAANSRYIQQRIKDAWERDSKVIYPPVDVSAIQALSDWESELNPEEIRIMESLPKDFILGASRFIPYKQLDLVIQAGDIAQMPVVIAGSGPEEGYLREIAADARVPVIFVIEPRSALLYALFQRTAAYVFPPVEDFGIMPVEAMAAGSAVIANAIGGASESVRHDRSGWLVHDMNASTLATAISNITTLDQVAIKDHARQFSKERFVKEIRSWVTNDGGL
jgi:glycosyltransferase involved in cell wall biosynthesis